MPFILFSEKAIPPPEFKNESSDIRIYVQNPCDKNYRKLIEYKATGIKTIITFI